MGARMCLMMRRGREFAAMGGLCGERARGALDLVFREIRVRDVEVPLGQVSENRTVVLEVGEQGLRDAARLGHRLREARAHERSELRIAGLLQDVEEATQMVLVRA